MFCPKCKSMMRPVDGKLVCRNPECGYEEDPKARTIGEKVHESEIKVVEGELDTLPKTRQECPECGHTEAYWFIRQTRAADEPATRFYICAKCNHRWREY